MQITNQTLIIETDIDSETHYNRAFDNREIELGISNDIEGFQLMVCWIEELKRKCQKQQVIVEVEPTGWSYPIPFIMHK